MKLLGLVLLLCLPLVAADFDLCSAGCTYSSFHAALAAAEAAGPGPHTITGRAGDTVTISGSVTFANRAGAEWLWIRSSQWWVLPDMFRPSVGDTRLFTIAITDPSHQFVYGVDPGFTQMTWKSTVNGNTISVGSDCSPTNPCQLRDTAGVIQTFTAPPCSVTLLGNSVPTSGTNYTGLRVGIGTDGRCNIGHKSDIAEMTHFTCAGACGDTSATNSTYAFHPATVPVVGVAYSTAGAITGSLFRPNWLHGPSVLDSSLPGLFNGLAETSYSGPAQGVHHIRWQGIRFLKNTTAEGYYASLHVKAAGADYRYVPHHIEFKQCAFHALKAHYGHQKILNLQHCDHCLVESCSFVNVQTRAEGQAISLLGGAGPLIVRNCSFDGGTEMVMAGGDLFMFSGPPQISIERSYFRNRWEQYPKSRLIRQADSSVLALTATDGVTRCNAGVCQVAYENSWYTYGQDSTITVTAGQAAKIFVAMASDGTLKVYHNANVTCGGDFICVPGTTSRASLPNDAVLWEWSAAAGAWGASDDWHVFYGTGGGTALWIMRKNHLEFKAGKRIRVIGNVFRYFWPDQQQIPVNLSVRNQWGQDVSNGADGFLFTRNWISSGHSGLGVFTFDDIGWNTFGRELHVLHNIFTDINRTNYGATTSGGQGITTGLLSANATVSGRLQVEHNTIDSERKAIETGAAWDTLALKTLVIRNNLFLWNPNSLGVIGGDAVGAWNPILRTSGTPPYALSGYISDQSEFLSNLNLGTGTIPGTNYGTDWADLASKNFGCSVSGSCGFRNVRQSSVSFGTHLVSVSSPMAYGDNLRLKPTSPYSKHCTSGCTNVPTTTGLDPGADVDWVETLTDGVVEGYPELARRWSVRVEPAGTTATLEFWSSTTATLQVAEHQNMVTLVYNSSTPSSNNGGRQIFTVTGLRPQTSYWYTIRIGGQVVKDRFLTGRT